MTADELCALADLVAFDAEGLPEDTLRRRRGEQAAAIIRKLADLQEPARKALFEYVETARSGRSTAEDIVVAADALAAIVQRIVEVGE